MTSERGDALSREIDRASALVREGALSASLAVLTELEHTVAAAPNLAHPDQRDGVAILHATVRIRLGRTREAISDLLELYETTGHGYVALHLGSALRLVGGVDDAFEHLGRALDGAKRSRDGVLAIATLCERGALEVQTGTLQAALASYGEALGLTEFTRDPRPSVAPLAGLATVHARAGRPDKANGLALRSLERAGSDRISRARALMAHAESVGDDRRSEAAAFAARVAPHVPLWVAAVAQRPTAVSTEHRAAAAAAATRAEMSAIAAALHT